MGAIKLGHEVARHLCALEHRKISSVYADKVGIEPDLSDKFEVKRDYGSLLKGKRVAVVEDVLNTGKSVKKVVDLVRAAGGDVICVAVLCNRGKVTTKNVGDVPVLLALIDLPLDVFTEEECPLCKEGKPVNTKLGKGAAYLARKESAAKV